MPFNQRLKIFEAINGSSIHQSLTTSSSQAAIARCQANIISDPAVIMETLRSLIQPEINKRIQKVMADVCKSHFQPAIQNIKLNLGQENVSGSLLEDVCISALEHAREIYSPAPRADPRKQLRGPSQVLKRSASCSTSNSPVLKKSMVIKSGLGRPNTDLILVNKAGKPVRREGPKWEPERLANDTLFILGSRANKALGFGQTRGRLYIKHPELFKYSGDQTDKEWLAKANLMATTGGKAYLMVLRDILDLAETPEYSSNPKQQPEELVGFSVPEWMIDKMKAYIETAKTNPETTDDELLRIAEEYAEMEEEGKKARRREEELSLEEAESKRAVAAAVAAATASAVNQSAGAGGDNGSSSSSRRDEELSLDRFISDTDENGPNVAQLLNDIKHEAVDDDLQNLDPGFLQGMNLHNLVREFEMEAGGESELNLLALADDTLPSLH